MKGGSVVFKQGDPGQNFYIIVLGSVEVVINKKKSNELYRGDSFGELALISNAPRSGTVRTLERTALWALNRIHFQQVLSSLNSLEFEEIHKFIQSVPLFQVLGNEEIEAMATSMTTHHLTDG